MNKDVIYIESSDDITNVVAKIENSKEKIVAVVPPKDAETFRSIINMKLIAKSSEKAGKTVVLVTTDAAILRLAAITRVPVTKDLQTAPAVPKVEELAEVKTATEETVEDEEVKNEEEKEKSEEDSEEKTEKEEKADTKKENDNAFVGWLKKYKKILIFSGIIVVVLSLFLVWAFVIAPSATVTVEIRTAKSNFSESVSFTSKLEEEKASEGKFFLEEKKDEATEEKKFTATGKKNLGEKASGEVTVSSYFREKDEKSLAAGTIFTISDLEFVSGEEVALEWDGLNPADCDNNKNATQMFADGCLISKKVKVTAKESGEKYNIGPVKNGWKEASGSVDVKSDEAMAGGTDKIVTVVQQSDIDKIKEQIAGDGKTSKEKLLAAINDSSMPIESSFKYEVVKVVSTPEVGKEVKEGEKATAKVTIAAKMYVLDKTKIEEFITNKAKLGEGYKIYSIDDPFVENFVESTAGFIGKLKTSYTAGAKITENEIVEKIRGRGLGDAQHDLKNIEGISSVKIDTPFPWVNSIPNDTNKIFVNLTVK